MATITQEQVLTWIRAHLEVAETVALQNGQLGPDWTWREGRVVYHIEAIGFSDRTKSGTPKRGKNQADFWKAFSQAISRLNSESPWGVADRVVIAVPSKFLDGWGSRVGLLGPAVWGRIGTAFPELQVWFVSKNDLLRLRWNEAFKGAFALGRHEKGLT